MKKLAMLLMSLGVVSVSTMGADISAKKESKLKVTKVSQELEYEHENHQQGGDINLATTVGLAYGDDWTFSIQGRKFWSYDKTNSRRVQSSIGQVQFDVWNKVADGLKLGYRLRSRNTYDRNYLRYSYSNGIFSSGASFAYNRANKKSGDWVGVDGDLLSLSLNGVDLTYHLVYVKYNSQNAKKNSMENKLSIAKSYDLYKEGNFTLSTDLKLEGKISKEKTKDKKDKKVTGEKRSFVASIYLKGTYKLSEAASAYVSVGNEFRKYSKKYDVPKEGDKNYQDITVGWTYKF